MKFEMESKVLKALLMVTLIIGLCIIGLAAELPTLEVKQAALKGLDIYSDIGGRLSPEQGQKMAATHAPSSPSMLAQGFPIYRVNEERLLYTGESFRYLTEAVGTWRFLVVSENKAVSLITVAEMEGQWRTVKIGGAGIAAKMQKIMKSWPQEEGYEFRFIRVYSAVQDLVEISMDDVILGYISLSPVAGVKESENNKFNTMHLLEESDFKGPLTDTVENSRLEYKMREEARVIPYNQPDSPAPAHSDHQDLSSVNSYDVLFLNVPEIEQEYSNWCWNGSTIAIFFYYNIFYHSFEMTMPDGSVKIIPLLPMMQCLIANWAWNDAGYNYGDSCGSYSFSTSQSWNKGNYLSSSYRGSSYYIFQNWGVTSTYKSSSLTFSEVKSEINALHPFIMSWGWTSGGGHALVGHGYQELPPNLELVLYMDPWPGEGRLFSPYDYVTSSSNHNWRGTLTTSY